MKTIQEIPDTTIKAIFMAQYFQQHVLKDRTYYPESNDFTLTLNLLLLECIYVNPETFYLALKSVSDITDEDALQGSKLVGGASHLSDESQIFQFKQLFESPNFWTRQTNIPLVKSLRVFDYLRSKGYALPFREYSVEDLISFGWIKLVQNEQQSKTTV